MGTVRRRGRPRAINYDLLKEILHSHEENLMSRADASVTPKSDGIGKRIFGSLQQHSNMRKNADSIYAFVVNNVDGIRYEMIKSLGIHVHCSPHVYFHQSSGNWEDSVLLEELTNFEFTMTNDEYSQIVDSRMSKRNIKGKVVEIRKFIFKPYEWLSPVNEKIWYASGRKSGYNNVNHYISTDKNSGNFKGEYKYKYVKSLLLFIVIR